MPQKPLPIFTIIICDKYEFMDISTATYLLLFAYAAFILFFVVRGALKIKSIGDYAIGNIQFSPTAVGLSLAASMTSAATFIINPGYVSLYGWSAFISFAIVLPTAAFISLIVLTKSFRKFGSSAKSLTLAQWMGDMYKNKWFSLFFALLSLLLITFIVLISVGLTKVISKAISGDEFWVLISVVTFIFGYMMFGGANSMVYTNTIQAILMIIVAILLISSGYSYFSDGIHGFIEQLNQVDTRLTESTFAESPMFRDYWEIIFFQIIVGVAIVCQPHIITKSLLLTNEKEVNQYLAVGIGVQILFFLVVGAGFYARLTFPDLKIGETMLLMDDIIPQYVVSEFPVWVALILILGLISAGLSTLEGLVQTLSTTLSSDIIKPLYPRNLSDSEMIRLNKIIIAFLAIVTIFISWEQIQNPNLSVSILALNGVYAYFSAAFIPVLLGIFFRRVPLIAPVAASVTAVVVHFSLYYGSLITYTQGAVGNPGASSAIAILSAATVGLLFLFIYRKPHLEQKEGQPQ